MFKRINTLALAGILVIIQIAVSILNAFLPSVIAFFYPFLYFLISWTEWFSPESKVGNIELKIVPLLFFILVIILGTTIIINSIYNKFFGKDRKNNVIEKDERKKNWEAEFSKAISTIEKKENNQTVKKDIIHKFMKKFEEEVKNIFNVEKEDIQCIWIVRNTTNQDQYLITCLDDIEDFETFRLLITTALQQTDSRIAVRQIKEIVPSSVNHQFTIVKNFGRFRLGFAVLLKKDNVFNEKNLQDFEDLSSYLLLLGFYDSFISFVRKVSKTQKIAS